MRPASRTPEGQPNECPICHSQQRIAASEFPTRDATCPNCGRLLWFDESTSNVNEHPTSNCKAGTVVLSRRKNETVVLNRVRTLRIIDVNEEEVRFELERTSEPQQIDPAIQPVGMFVGRASETVRIGGNINVTILETRRDKARLAFEVPSDTSLYRGEVNDAIRGNSADD